jgi:HK97 family phage major capsid protein
VPPIWLMDEYATVVRMGRPFANFGTRNMGATPPNSDSINIPKLTSGSATATQSDGGSVQNTDAATSSVAVGVKTIAGEQSMSRQLFDRALPGADQIFFSDLIADYNTKLDIQCLSGGGTGANAKGVLSDTNRVTITYTDTTPTVAELYSKVADAIQQITTLRGLPPDTITFHPRRWAWITAATDTTGRPLVIPNGIGQNQPGTSTKPNQLGLPGFTFQGLEVVVDANLPITDGTGTNEDKVIVSRSQDNLLWEDPTPRTRVDESRLSGNLQVVLQLWSYFAFTTERYSKGNASIGGTGLVAPTF